MTRQYIDITRGYYKMWFGQGNDSLKALAVFAMQERGLDWPVAATLALPPAEATALISHGGCILHGDGNMQQFMNGWLATPTMDVAYFDPFDYTQDDSGSFYTF